MISKKIVSRTFGTPGDTETEFGECYEMRISVPMRTRVMRRVEGNEYVSSSEWVEAAPSEMKVTTLRRFPLSDLFPFVKMALANNHEFEILYHDDSRSGGSGAAKLRQADQMKLYRFLLSLESSPSAA